MNSVETLVRMIDRQVRGGATPSQVYKDLEGFIPADQLREAFDQFGKLTGRIRILKIPPALVESNTESWYTGPSSDGRFWPALRRLLEERGWDAEVIESLDMASTRVVSLLEHPGQGRISTRGLVLGYVQSGKTANFSAVIAKAADVSYKFYIVMSGITNPLRAQTQSRLERELVNLNPQDWVALTSQTDDFRPGPAGNVNAFLTDHSNQRVLCVVKKNAAVLRRLLRWLNAASPAVLNSCPVLMIDDEADQASVNASGSEEKRTAINKLILDILQRLPKAAYVGYTATPFANVFINPADFNDLYPRNFIVDLPRPKDYFGPERVFGRQPLDLDGETDPSGLDGLDMIRHVPDSEVERLKPRGQNDRYTFEPELTPTLQEAINYFWLATAARATRGDSDKHSSMLIHTTLYTAVHNRFRPLIQNYQAAILRRLRSNDAALLAVLRALWQEEQERVPSASVGEVPTSFDTLLPYLAIAVERTQVTIENNQSTERLQYGEEGCVQIIVGGNTLSRGLTLEGLVVSFFVRASTAYDTLLQMGRWFGYRQRYADLPRIWMTRELEGYFFDLATVEQEIRNDIRRYELEDLTPAEFAPRIRTHPALSITAKLKMTAAIEIQVSYSNRRLQTILFKHRNADWLRTNLRAAATLLSSAVETGVAPEKHGNNLVFANLDVADILDFLSHYRFHENSTELRTEPLTKYILAQNEKTELRRWNVVVIGRKLPSSLGDMEIAPGLSVPLLNRSRFVVGPVTNDYANLKAIMSDIDRVADLGYDRATLAGKEPQELQGMRPAGVGLLLLYPISKDSKPERGATEGDRGRRVSLNAVEHLIGAGLVFPRASDQTPQSYMTVDLSSIQREEVEWPDEEDEEEGIR